MKKYLRINRLYPAPDKVNKRKINLQLFADSSKTEKATPKKRKDARKKGQVLQSREIAAAVMLIFIFISLKAFGGYIYRELTVYTGKTLTEYLKTENLLSVEMLFKLMRETVFVFVKVTAPVFAVAVVSGLVVGYSQVGFLFTAETLGFKFDRINPLKGFKRLFSAHAIVELVKAIIKITVVGFIAYIYLKGEAANAINLMNRDLIGIITYIGTISVNVAIRICMALIILGFLDYGYQWWEYEKNLRMSKQEIKEEYKQIEGNPEIKSKIKQKQREMSMKRMLQEVPRADVIITNPTHFAVAIRYDPDKSDAPLVTAKGQDFIALRIREVAKENKIEIVENKPLARTLYDTVDVGSAIPPELYQAVAEVLAFVFSLKEKGRAG